MNCALCNKPASTQIRKPLSMRTRGSNGNQLPEDQCTQLPDETTPLCQACATEVRESLSREQRS
jgi:hypothetical protein